MRVGWFEDRRVPAHSRFTIHNSRFTLLLPHIIKPRRSRIHLEYANTCMAVEKTCRSYPEPGVPQQSLQLEGLQIVLRDIQHYFQLCVPVHTFLI